MGTLTYLELIDPESNIFTERVQEALRTDGDSASLGVPGIAAVGPAAEFPVWYTEESLDQKADNLEFATQQAVFWNAFHSSTMAALDVIPMAGALNPFGVIDPTFPIPAPKIIAILTDLGIDPIPEWLETNLPALATPDLIPAFAGFAICENDKLAKAFVDIDSTLDEDTVKEKLSNHCGFNIPELPSLDFEIPIPGLDLEPLFGPPEFNGLLWKLIAVFEKIPGLLISFMTPSFDLAAELLKGIPGFIMWIIEFLFETILELFMAVFEFLKQCVILIACVIVWIKDVVAAIVVSIIGFLVGPGLIVTFAAVLLGLIGLPGL